MYPILFAGTPFEIRTWWLCAWLTVLIVPLMLVKRPRHFAFNNVQLLQCIAIIVFSGLAGSRIASLILHWDIYVKSPWSFRWALYWFFFDTGFVAIGGVIGQALGILAFTKIRIYRVSYFEVVDFLIPFQFLYGAIIRVGCFFSGCCHGVPTDLPWGINFPEAGVPSHPTQLYETLFFVAGYFLLRYLYNKKLKPGTILFSGFFIFGLFRFFLEFLRFDTIQFTDGFWTVGQWVMLLLMAVSVLGILFINVRGKVIETVKWLWKS